MDPRRRAQLADAVQEAPASARGLTDGLKVNPVSVTKHGWRTLKIKCLVLSQVSGYVRGAFKAGVTPLKNMLIVRTKTTDINLEMELSASEEGDLQYVQQVLEPSQPPAPCNYLLFFQISLWHAPLEKGVQVEFAIAASNQ